MISLKKVQRVDNHFCPIRVTNAKSKKVLIDLFDNHFLDRDHPIRDYWIGDVVNKDMVCGDDLFIQLWNRIRDQVTKGSKTKKNY